VSSSVAKVYQHFRGPCCFQHQGDEESNMCGISLRRRNQLIKQNHGLTSGEWDDGWVRAREQPGEGGSTTAWPGEEKDMQEREADRIRPYQVWIPGTPVNIPQAFTIN
jgi:hypothetical protein